MVNLNYPFCYEIPITPEEEEAWKELDRKLYLEKKEGQKVMGFGEKNEI